MKDDLCTMVVKQENEGGWSCRVLPSCLACSTVPKKCCKKYKRGKKQCKTCPKKDK